MLRGVDAGDASRAHVAPDVARLAVHPHEPGSLHRERAAQERYAQVLPAPGARALEERGGDREGQQRGRVEVHRGAVDDLGIARLALLLADAGHGLEHLVVAGAVLERPPIAVAGQRAVDQALVQRPHPVVVDAQARGHRRPEVVDQHVGALDQPAQHAQAVGMLEVEAEAALVAIDPEEGPALARDGGRVVAEVVALGRLDLDDEGALVAEQGAAVGTGHVAAQIEHDDAAQGPVALSGIERGQHGGSLSRGRREATRGPLSGWRRRWCAPSDRTRAPGSDRRPGPAPPSRESPTGMPGTARPTTEGRSRSRRSIRSAGTCPSMT